MSAAGGGMPDKVAVLLAAGVSAWERDAVEALKAPGAGTVLVKRCLDLTDLLATAAVGSADVAVVADGLPGLDGDSLARLARHGVRVVAVAGSAGPAGPSGRGPDAVEAALAHRSRLLRLGVVRVLDEASLPDLASWVREAARQDLLAPATPDAPGPRPPGSAREDPVPVPTADARRGAVVAVWGPTGAPGRTTVALGLAAEAATRGHPTMLVDADPYGGAAGLCLAVLDEVSGLLAAARAANAGQLETPRLADLAREVAPDLRLLSGLPRPDRWTDVRATAFAEVLTVARSLDDLVVVDTGFGLPERDPDPFDAGPRRDEMTAAALEEADVTVVVGAADPVGLTRLARALPELLDRRRGGPVHVVVNRSRPTLGWSEREVRYLVHGVAPRAEVTFLPDDRAAADAALVAGRTLTQGGDSALRRAVAGLADDVLDPLLTAATAAVSRRGHLRRQPRSSGRSPGRSSGRVSR